MNIQIEKLVYGGDGLARVDGEVVLSPFVLPGESVDIEREAKRGGIARGRVTAVSVPSIDRVEPPCPYFGRCGGCHYQHAAYPAQLAAKRSILEETLRRTGKIETLPAVEIISGEPWGYRNRIQLHFDKARVGYRESRSHQLCAIERCPIASPRLNECISALNRMVRDRRWPPFLAAAELFTNETDVQFNVLSTGRPLAQRFFDWCKEEMPGLVSGALEYDGYRVSYGTFFQVNRFLVRPLIDAILAGAHGESVVDLYAGAGLFSIPLAGRFGSVTAVESGISATRDLVFNAERAGARIEVRAETADAYLATTLTAPDCVVADPPRTGLGKHVVGRLLDLAPRAITVVACDPATLARDAQALLAGGYRLDALTLIDLFPQTFHIETIARFSRAASPETKP